MISNRGQIYINHEEAADRNCMSWAKCRASDDLSVRLTREAHRHLYVDKSSWSVPSFGRRLTAFLRGSEKKESILK